MSRRMYMPRTSVRRRDYTSSEEESELGHATKKLKKAVKYLRAVRRRSSKQQQGNQGSNGGSNRRRVASSSSEYESENENVSDSDMISGDGDSYRSDYSDDDRRSEAGRESSEHLKKLTPEVLRILGQPSPPSETLGEVIHKEVVQIWSDILQKGMDTEDIKKLLVKYPPIANCRLVEAPKLNLEVKKVITRQHLERDERLAGIQNQIGGALSAIGKALTSCLLKEGEEWHGLIELLGDVGKLLAAVHFAESQSRRVLASAGINKNFKSTLTDVSVDGWLFGENLSERLKTSKALDRTSEDLRVPKPKVKKNSASKSYHLNSKSLPRKYYYQNRGRQRQLQKRRMEVEREGRTRIHTRLEHHPYRPRSEPPPRKH